MSHYTALHHGVGFYERLLIRAVLKSTGSAFENFVRDEYTTLVELDDRIFSTSVDLRYTYGEVAVEFPKDDKRLNFGEQNFDRIGTGEVDVWEDARVGARAREITMDVFANDESASVQVRRMRGNGGVAADNVIVGFDTRLMIRTGRRHCTRWRSAYSLRTRGWRAYDMCCRTSTTFQWT